MTVFPHGAPPPGYGLIYEAKVAWGWDLDHSVPVERHLPEPGWRHGDSWTREECIDSAWRHYGEWQERLQLPLVYRGNLPRNDDIVAASFRRTVEDLEERLRLAREQRAVSGRMFDRARDDRQKLQLTLLHLREVMVATGISHLIDVFDESLEKAEKLTEKKWRENEEGKDKR